MYEIWGVSSFITMLLLLFIEYYEAKIKNNPVFSLNYLELFLFIIAVVIPPLGLFAIIFYILGEFKND